MHPILAQYLKEWRKESLYPSDSDWVFPSYRCKGKIPLSASTCGKDYLRPAAVSAGVIKADENVRFGWHNLRHSLATYFGSQEVPVQVIQKMLRHKKLEMTLHYTHGVNKQHTDAQKTVPSCNWVWRGETNVGLKFGLSLWSPNTPKSFGMCGGDDGARTRDLCRDR